MPSTLDTIPAELRLKIYRNLLILPEIKLCNPHDTGSVQGNNGVDYGPMTGCKVKTPPQFLAILSVCKLIRTEALEVLFNENMFVAGEYRKCTNAFFTRSYTKQNGSKIMERASGLTNIVIRGRFAVYGNILSEYDRLRLEDYSLSKDDLVCWKQLKPGQIVPLNSGIYHRFPKFSQAQMARFAAKATKIGTQITAIANVSDYSINANESFAFRFKILPISKKRMKAEKLWRTYDLLLLGIE